jgi:hypothetical protein
MREPAPEAAAAAAAATTTTTTTTTAAAAAAAAAAGAAVEPGGARGAVSLVAALRDARNRDTYSKLLRYMVVLAVVPIGECVVDGHGGDARCLQR